MLLRVLAALAALPCLWTAWSWVCVIRNWLVVRKTGLPYVILPIDHANPLWMVGHKMIVPIFRKMPFGSGKFTRFGWRGWDFVDKYKVHAELGDAFFIVTPGDIQFHVCDRDAIADIFKRKLDFPRPLKIFGTVCLLLRIQC